MTDGTEGAVGEPVHEGWLPGWLRIYLTGLAMGSADAVPGVSGGTIALIAGVYDRLVGAIAAFDPRPLADATRERSIDPVVDLLVEMDVRFLIALGLGAVTGIVTIAQALEFGYTNYPAPTYAFFFGLIAASAVALSDEVVLTDRRRIAAGAAGLALGVLASGEFSAAIGRSPLTVLVVGAFSICAMILPGLSGAFVLLVLGLHDFLARQLNAFVEGVIGLATGGSVDGVVGPGTYVLAYGVGAAAGLLTFARVVEAALERDRAATLTFLVGLMVGALRVPLREVLTNLFETFALSILAPGLEIAGPPTAAAATVTVLAAVVGGVLILALDRYTGGMAYD